MRNIFGLIAIMVVLVGCAAVGKAQQSTKVPRIGVLNATSAASMASRMELFRQGLRDLGYVEGQNIVAEYRYADGKLNRLPEITAELVRLNVAVIVAGGGQSIRAAKNATTTIPIVMTQVVDPMEFVASLAGTLRDCRPNRRSWEESGWNCSRKWSPSSRAWPSSRRALIAGL